MTRSTILRSLVLALAAAWCWPSSADAVTLYRKHVQDTEGRALVGAEVTIKRAGTNELATLYKTIDATAVKLNPITTGPDGMFWAYIDDGFYDIYITHPDAAIPPALGLPIFASPWGENIYPNAMFQTDDLAAPTIGAFAKLGSTVGMLLIARPAPISDNALCPSTLTVMLVGKGEFQAASTKTLTLSCRVINMTGRGPAVYAGAGSYVFNPSAGKNPYGADGVLTASYGTTIDLDAGLAETWLVEPTDNVAFAFNLPAHPTPNREIEIWIKNTTGGALGAGTFPNYKTTGAWTQPANNKKRFIRFRRVDSTWSEIGRSTADVDVN